MNISLTPEFERRIAEKVESGLYTTASEVVREALRLLFAEDEERRRLIAQFNTELQEGIDDLDHGDAIDGEELSRRLSETIERRRRAS
jgi:antitoxin ParD1/3/4